MSEANNNFATTVLPKDDHAEGKQHSQGQPGIHLPKNADDIKEFSQVRNVDAKALNEQIAKAEQEAKDKVNELSK
ncbi:GTP-binding protein [Sugiyamaella lignohabitans]|uniref:GTP-binding protein n=1 Tax=Sugiyamaella lignohabitans TaxID=796027 RepID=A0A167CVY6_9ASCO|nr:GTP-binding protein [Sugiyamaella lignohabitans]ANB12170.1 GTP-binding protein [Sugiyamaella lignohabitans]